MKGTTFSIYPRHKRISLIYKPPGVYGLSYSGVHGFSYGGENKHPHYYHPSHRILACVSLLKQQSIP